MVIYVLEIYYTLTPDGRYYSKASLNLQKNVQ